MLAIVAGLEETLKNAVSANDKNAIASLSEKADAFRAAVSELAAVRDQAALAGNLGREFQDYFVAAKDSVSMMLGLQTGDVQARVLAMQGAQAVLHRSLADYKSAAVARFEADLLAIRADNRTQLLVSMLAGLLLVVGIGAASLFLIPSITRPIQQAVSVAEAMAGGDISQIIHISGRDEMTQLLQAMQAMVTSFKQFAAAQQDLATNHAAGNTDHMIAADQFPGIYGDMARATNAVAQTHITVTKKVVEVVARYAVGDLSVDMARLPGKQAEITAAMDGVKSSLRAMSGEINHLVEAATRGDFRVRVEGSRYQHDFRKMVEELNRLMEVNETGLDEVTRVL